MLIPSPIMIMYILTHALYLMVSFAMTLSNP